MAKKGLFPRVEACVSFVDVRRLLSQVRWCSPEYRTLMNQWRFICRTEIFKIHGAPNRSAHAELWCELYAQCPSGSPEEKVALGLWQERMPRDPDLEKYRRRIICEGHNLLSEFAPELI